MEKMTNVKAVSYVLENCALPTEVAEKLEAIKASYEKKSSGVRKPTAHQTENAGVKTAILEALEPNTLYTITDIGKSVPACAEFSSQRVSAIVTQLVKEGALVRTEEKRKAYFSLAE